MRYTRKELVSLTGISPAQFARWRYKGLLPPPILPNGYKGAAYYTDQHKERIQAIIATLIDGKVTMADLRERFYWEEHPEDLDDGDVF